jgi:hypothetical protein
MLLSIRTPPTLKSKEIAEWAAEYLTQNPPYNAKVTVIKTECCEGFNAKKMPVKF